MHRGSTAKGVVLVIAMAAISCLVCACSGKSATEVVFWIKDSDAARPVQEEKAASLLKHHGIAIDFAISMTGHVQFYVAAEDSDRARRLIQQGIKDGNLDGSVVKVNLEKKAVTTKAQ
jgi:hypothetical protein